MAPAFLSVCTIVAQAISLFQDANMSACVDFLITNKDVYDQSLISSDEMLCTFFHDDRVQNSYLIFALGYELDKTDKGKEMMDTYVNSNVVKIVRSDYTSIMFQADRGVNSTLAVNTKVPLNGGQYAYFGTDTYINTNSAYMGGNKFSLKVMPSNYEFQLMSNFGVESFLCPTGVMGPNGKQSAYFGTSQRLIWNSWTDGQNLRLHPVSGGRKFMIQASYGDRSYLYVNYYVEKGKHYRWAKFGTARKIDSEDAADGKVFKLIFQQ